MDQKENKHLLTVIEIVEGGSVNLNRGKIKGKRLFIKTAEGMDCQAWVTSDRSLGNFPIMEPRYYYLTPMQYLGKDTWKISPARADELTDKEKSVRRTSMAGTDVRTNAPHRLDHLSADQSLRNTIVSAVSVLGAVILVANNKENHDEIVPRALILKDDIKTIIDR